MATELRKRGWLYAMSDESLVQAVLVLHRKLEDRVEEALRDYIRIEALLIRELGERLSPGAADDYRREEDAVPRTSQNA